MKLPPPMYIPTWPTFLDPCEKNTRSPAFKLLFETFLPFDVWVADVLFNEYPLWPYT